MNRVAIVIPMFNESRHIGRTLVALREAARRRGAMPGDRGRQRLQRRQPDGLPGPSDAEVLSLPGLSIGALAQPWRSGLRE